jgi:hypothetical protein
VAARRPIGLTPILRARCRLEKPTRKKFAFQFRGFAVAILPFRKLRHECNAHKIFLADAKLLCCIAVGRGDSALPECEPE